MNKITSISIGLILIISIASLVLWQKNAVAPMPINPVITATSTTDGSIAGTPAPTGPRVISSTEVAGHNSRTSCWSTINGKVYDLTSWIPEHPGGEEAILELCGNDGSAKFNGQHGGAVRQATILAGFKIGSATK